jgi:transcriptional regulator
VLQRQIETTDRQIDALVYRLYGLTDAEIAVVEGAGR